MTKARNRILARGRKEARVSARRQLTTDGITWDLIEYLRVLALRDAGLSWSKMADAYRLTPARLRQVWQTALQRRQRYEEMGISWADTELPPGGLLPPVWRCMVPVSSRLVERLSEPHRLWTRPTLTRVTLYCDEAGRNVQVLTAVEAAQSRIPVSCCRCTKRHTPIMEGA